MNPAQIFLLIEGLLKILGLVDRLIEAQGLKDKELEDYITTRNEVRKNLVKLATELGPDEVPTDGDEA